MSKGKKILVTGYSGLVGSSFVNSHQDSHLICISRGQTPYPFKKTPNMELHNFDLSNASLNQIENLFRKTKPNLVLHFIAITGDKCQENPQYAEKINWGITFKLALVCQKMNIPMGFCSTADVFPRNGGPFVEDDPTGVIYNEAQVLNIYSATKYRAEKVISEILFPKKLGFIFRIAFPYNFEYLQKPGTPVLAFNSLARGQTWVSVKDMHLNPTPAKSIALALNSLILNQVWLQENPIFHVASSEILTGLDLANICLNELKKRGVKVNKKQIKIITSDQFFKTPRQIKGGLITEKIKKMGIKIPNFREEVKNLPLPGL